MIYCPNCGKRTEGAFCTWCGTRAPTRSTQDVPQVKGKQNADWGLLIVGYVCVLVALFLPFPFSLAALVIGILSLARRNVRHGIALIVLAVACVVAGTLIRSHNDSKVETPTNAPNPGAEVARPQRAHAIGETFSVGYWSYRCNGASWQQFIASGYGSIERPDAAFLILDLYAGNDDRTASTLPPLKLIDSQGREFDESSKGIFLNGSFETFKQLNPGVSSRGFVVFDVPPGDYMLKVSGGILSGKYALVDLSSELKQEPSREPTQTLPPPETAASGGPIAANSEQVAKPTDLLLQVAATERLWVAVDADGKTVLQKVLNPNEVEKLKALESFDVTVGNAQGVVLTLNGETLKPLGRRGEVKSVHLTRADLKNSTAAPAPSQPALPDNP